MVSFETACSELKRIDKAGDDCAGQLRRLEYSIKALTADITRNFSDQLPGKAAYSALMNAEREIESAISELNRMHGDIQTGIQRLRT
ncbi:MAG: hypothetical protein ACI4PP_05365 [Clostridia bacterium]